MDDVANMTELPGDEVDPVLDIVVVLSSELPDGVLRVGVDEHGQEHLAFEWLASLTTYNYLR